MTGAVITAASASLCCIGPVVLLALGVGGAWASRLHVLEPYRPALMALTLTFLGFALYRTYRVGNGAACRPDGSCGVTRSTRLQRLGLWVMSVVILALLAFPYVAPRLLANMNNARTTETDGANTARAVLKVQNLTCDSCAAAARTALLRVGGVKGAQVTVEPPIAVVTYDPTKATVAALMLATAHAGYPSSVGQDAGSADCCEPIRATAPADRRAGAGERGGATPVGPTDPEREIVLNVDRLGCPLVSGVGCGHMLAPALVRIEKMKGVSRAYSNWTGTRLRISVAPTADRETVASEVINSLAQQEHAPTRMQGKELVQVMKDDQWYSVDGIRDLSLFEFRTYTKHRLTLFSQSEGLDKAKADKLLEVADELWDEVAKSKDGPPIDQEGYAAFWHDHIGRIKAALLERAADTLTADQLARLAKANERQK